LSKIPVDVSRGTSTSKKMQADLKTELKNDSDEVDKIGSNFKTIHNLKSPLESELVEFNVYDFTRQKDSFHRMHEVNNANDTAEFGEGEQVDQFAETTKPDYSKPLPLHIDADNEDRQKKADKENRYHCDLEQELWRDDVKTQKENKDRNASSGKKHSLEEQIIDYFARYSEDEKPKIVNNKASSLSLHPSRLPKYPKNAFSPVNSQLSNIKYKTINKTANHGLDFSQARIDDDTFFPKNLVPVNLSATLSKWEEFTYKSPNDLEFNEFMTDDQVEVEEGSLKDYIGDCKSPESVPLNERLKRYESQFGRS